MWACEIRLRRAAQFAHQHPAMGRGEQHLAARRPGDGARNPCPALSTSKSWWLCLMTDTAQARPRPSRGSRRSMRVVLPAAAVAGECRGPSWRGFHDFHAVVMGETRAFLIYLEFMSYRIAMSWRREIAPIRPAHDPDQGMNWFTLAEDQEPRFSAIPARRLHFAA
jgi:hypothetical protein